MTNNAFYENFREHNIRHYCFSTHNSKNRFVKNHFLPLYGDKEVGAISYQDINRVYDTMEADGLTQNTIFGGYAALLSYFKLAIGQGEIEENPVKYARSIRPAARY